MIGEANRVVSYLPKAGSWLRINLKSSFMSRGGLFVMVS